MPNGEEFGHLSDRELLVLIADRIKVLPDHAERIDTLESHSDKQDGFIRATTWLGAILWGIITFLVGNHLLRGGK